ncbi:SDR family NAD(P)-dependent oxidoreductase [Pediococcus acidilactici]|uniref:SDR family NAD(P)-dependent oxidoreductase n=1 Tax=Pediococcus acidilactici TaxID=1254 RepID=UPI003A9313C2
MVKIGVVTGGTRGIGKRIVEQQLRHGNTIITTYGHNTKNAEEVTQDLRKYKGNFELRKVSVNDEKSQHELANFIRQKYGRIDFLVNNAGISISDFSLHLPLEEWERVLNINLTGTFMTVKFLVPLMLKSSNASIVNISSQVGLTGNHGQIAYSASKAGVNGITKSLAQELSRKNIRVNSVAPGFIETNMLGEMSDEELERKRSNVLLERFGKPEEIANVVDFLISERSSYVNSSIINVDGGRRF